VNKYVLPGCREYDGRPLAIASSIADCRTDPGYDPEFSATVSVE
jgi:hypothetical protein